MMGLSTDIPAGTLIGGEYRVVRKLADGGMGAVFVARQESTGSLRALKIIRGEWGDDPEFRARFDREARLSARIKSDHVVQIVHAGTDAARGVEFLVMELLEGETLASRVARRGPVPPLDALTMARQMAHALSAAHAIGVIHRDLKPENVFLADATRAGEPFVLKILDFGIAKVLADAKTASTKPLGTPAWLAPEQTDRKSKVGPETDVWAFGLVVFFVLTGKSYWLASNDEEAGLSMLMREVLIDPLAAASTRAAAIHASAALPDGFDAWFARTVVRDPKARFPSIAHAASALEALLGDAPHDSLAERPTEFALAGTPGELAPSPPQVTPPPKPASSGQAWIAISLGGLLLAGAGAFALWSALHTADEPSKRIASTSAASPSSSVDRVTPAPSTTGPRRGPANPWVHVPAAHVDMQEHEVTRAEFGDADAQHPNFPKTGLPWGSAKAYCVSIGGRLPDESEWRAASQPLEAAPPAPDAVPAKAIGPVGQRPTDRAGGLSDLWGNALEWTSTPSDESGPKRWIVLGRSLVRAEALGRYAIGASPDARPLQVVARLDREVLELDDASERTLESCADVPFEARVTIRRGSTGKPAASHVELTPRRSAACQQVFQRYPWDSRVPSDTSEAELLVRVSLQAPDLDLSDVGFRCARDAKP